MDLNKDKLAADAEEIRAAAESGVHDNVRITRSKLAFDQLSIVDEDRGGDPYNSTGAYCIFKARDAAKA